MDITNFSIFDWNGTYVDIFEPSEGVGPEATKDPLQVATDVIMICGFVVNVALLVLIVYGLVRSPQQRRLPRMWLLLGLLVSHLLYLISVKVFEHSSSWSAVTESQIFCVLTSNLPTCFDSVSVLMSAALAYQVFMCVYVPKAEQGRRTLLFWIIAEIAAWVAGFAVVLGLRAPETEIVNFGDSAFCLAWYRNQAVNIICSCVLYLLPFTCSLPVTLVSLWVEQGRSRQQSIPLAPLPVATQSNPEYFGVDPAKPDEGENVPKVTQESKMEVLDRVLALLPWVIFNIINIFLGLALRMPEQLLLQEFISDAVFDSSEDTHKFWLISRMLLTIYFSFVSLICLLLPEFRNTLVDVYKLFKC